MPIRMTSTATYRTWVVLFRRLKYSGLVVAVLGGLIGLVDHASARIVIWTVSALLAIWLWVAGMVQQRRYRRVLDQEQQDEEAVLAGTSLRMATPMSGPSNGDERDRAPLLSRKGSVPMSVPEIERWRLSTLHRYEHFFMGVALAGVGITIAGVVISFFVSDAARAAIIAGLGVGGLWISAMSLVIRRRIRTGPKRQSPGS
jgi:small-conductance mechanosensitive channel